MRPLSARLQISVRVLADLILLNASLALALLPELLFSQKSRAELFQLWLPVALFLSLAGPGLFYVMGFYTKGRSYMSKYKALVVLQAAGILFMAAAVCLYFFRLQPAFPRSAFLATWLGASLLLVGARLWAQIWRRVVLHEHQQEHAIVKNHQDSVLVIGGAGYVGSALLPKLLDQGYRVRLLDCFLYGDEPIKPFMQHPNLEIQRGDFRHVDNVVAAMKGMNAVVHLGGLVGDPACAIDEELTIQINLIATRMIAQVAKGAGISRFVFASSCSVYGASDHILNERSKLNPVSLYAKSKIASENVLLAIRDNGFEPVILRFGTIYGLSGRTRFDLVVNLLAAKALVDKIITVHGRDQWRPFLHVHDAARSVQAALEADSDSVSPIIFNVGSDEQNLTLGQVGELIHAMVPDSVIHCKEDNVDRRNYRVEFRRIRETLGFQPVWKLEAGVQQVLDAIRSGKVTNYQDSKYSNVKFLSAPDAREQLPVMEDWVSKYLDSNEVMVNA
ncbi:MAG: NAD-dependent epimerase/dehydratase family protein [Acidobacteria bacterium]|nr:NAD-dependent epimerase/dehydratase family protein [Acidobacteriota bacterium]